MGKRRRSSTRSAQKRDSKTVAFWGFMALALVVAAGMYWVTSARATDVDASYTSSYTPETSTGWEPLQVTRTLDQPLVVQYIGDSVTRGSGASGEGTTFRAQVTFQLEGTGPVEQHVSAIGGATLSRVAAETKIVPKANLVIIELGTNDSGQELTPLDVFSSQYVDLLNRVRTEAPEAAILCLGMWRGAASAYDSVVQNVCTDQGGAFATLADLANSQANRGPEGRPVYGSGSAVGDNFHPNDDGHAAIATRVTDSLSLI